MSIAGNGPDGPGARDALETAARTALRAPSVFNTQPWKWRITDETLELSADPARRLGVTDAEGRLLLLSCGGALHHARTALAAAGWGTKVLRLPDENRPDLLARLTVTGRVAKDPEAVRLAAAIARRRTDRRPYSDRRITSASLERLADLVKAEGAALYEVPAERVPELAVAVGEAADMEYFSPDHRGELTRWTHRPAWTGDGIPPSTVVVPSHRLVPVRNLLPGGTPGLLAGAGEDEGAVFVILCGDDDRPLDLLRAGEAMSALLLRATVEGMSSAPISEAVEVAWPRQLLRRLIPKGSEPYLIIRLGYAEAEELPPVSPRREPRDILQIDDQVEPDGEARPPLAG